MGGDSLTIALTGGLGTRLDDLHAIQLSTQACIGSASQQLVYMQQDLATLTSVVDTKATASSLVAGQATKSDKLDAASSVTVGSLHATTGTIDALTVTGATRLEGATVDVLGTINANIVTAGTMTATNATATIGFIGAFGSNGST